MIKHLIWGKSELLICNEFLGEIYAAKLIVWCTVQAIQNFTADENFFLPLDNLGRQWHKRTEQ